MTECVGLLPLGLWVPQRSRAVFVDHELPRHRQQRSRRRHHELSRDFGDGTSASGRWGAAPPAEVAHEYLRDDSGGINCQGVVNGAEGVCVVTLTVTDSSGQSDSDVLLMVFLNQSPG